MNPPAAPSPAGGGSSPLARVHAHLGAHDWEAVVRGNRSACERERAQHGPNPETHAAVALEWSLVCGQETTLGAAFDFLLECHRRTPFLFENADTFAQIGRALAHAMFAHLPVGRRRALDAAAADYVSGLLDRTELAEIFDGLSRGVVFRPGDRVKTLRGATRGVVLQCLPDGRVLWRPKGSDLEMVAPPEGLLPAGI